MSPTDHPQVGSHSFQFAHRTASGWERRCFYIKPGDSPDFWRARLLMPGAENCGLIYAVFEDDGAIRRMGDERPYVAYVHAGRSTWAVELFCVDDDDCHRQMSEIGALSGGSDRPLSMWARADAVCRWFWVRRPVVRWRSPLERF